MAEVFVSVGSNIDKEKNVASCIRALRERFGTIKESSVYVSEAVGFDGDDFLNMVVSFETDMSPREVTHHLNAIEKQHGRVKGKNSLGPRQLDLDQLLYDDLVCNEDGICLPHKDIVENAFVIVPLAEISGSLKHPVLNVGYVELRDRLGDVSNQIRKVDLDLDSR